MSQGVPEAGVLARVRGVPDRTADRICRLEDRIAERILDRYAVAFTYASFAFVFFYFGIQKPAPVDSPVRTPVAVFVQRVSELLSTIPLVDVQISAETALVFIGTYEMFMGLLFLFQLIRVVFWVFLAHQAVTFVSIVLTWRTTFQPPWLEVLGMEFPWVLGSFSAFVLKNLLFVAAFMFLASRELGGERGAGSSESRG